MDEPFDTRTMLLSALVEGLGQLTRGRTGKGLALLGTGLLFSILGGVLGTLLRILTFGHRPIKALPDRLNKLALVWLVIYLYNLYDAYNLASGAEDEADLFDYEEYEPQEILSGAAASGADRAAGSANASAGPPATAGHANGAAQDEGTAGGTGFAATATATAAQDGAQGSAEPNGAAGADNAAQGADLGTAGHNVAQLGTGADQLAAAGDVTGGDGAAATGEDTGPAASTGTTAAGGNAPPASGAGAATGPAASGGAGTGALDWDAGVTKAQLMESLGDDEDVRGVFGQYLPSDRVFHSYAEVENLIPVQAWQEAQGGTWAGQELPAADDSSGYRDSAAGRMPPGDQSAGTVQ